MKNIVAKYTGKRIMCQQRISMANTGRTENRLIQSDITAIAIMALCEVTIN